MAALALLGGMVWLRGSWFAVNGQEDAVQLAVATTPVPLLPYHTHPANASPLEHGVWASGIVVVPEDIWIRSFSVTLNGTPVPEPDTWRNPVHQVSIEKEGVADAWCPALDALLFLSGNSIFSRRDGKMAFQSNYAEFVPKGTLLRLNVLWHNTAQETFNDLRAAVTMKGYRPGKATERFVNVERYGITPAGCEGRTVGHITIPPRVQDRIFSTLAAPLIFPRDGKIILLGTHFHPDDGGKKLSVLLNDEPIFEVVSRTSSGGKRDHLIVPAGGIRVKQGDRLTMSATYDNTSSVPNAAAMAIASVFFAEEGPASR